MKMKRIPRVLKINSIEGYKISCLFSSGESRIIDFEILFKNWNLKENDLEYILQQDIEAFRQVTISNYTLSWQNISIALKDEEGNRMMVPYEIDPSVIYENSILDTEKGLQIGSLIKNARKKAGLTQEELAQRSGTTKHYISPRK